MGFIRIHFFLQSFSIVLSFFLVGWFLAVLPLSPEPDLTHGYPTQFPTLISIVTTLVLYLLSPIDITTLITSYPTNLTTILIIYPTNLPTLLITYLIDLTITNALPSSLIDSK
jgi:hypothetical protein